MASEERHPRLQLLGKALVNPLVILLLVLAGFSFATGDFRAGGVMLLMVVLGVVLRFVQEARADDAAAMVQDLIKAQLAVVYQGKVPDHYTAAEHIRFCCPPEMNPNEFFRHVDVRHDYLGVALPASTTVEVRRLAHPDLMVEIEAIAVQP